MPRHSVSKAAWKRIQRTLPPKTPKPYGGRPQQLADREALEGILFVLKHNILWSELPQELGYGCGMTCFRRLRAWQAGGVWKRIERVLKIELRSPNSVDWQCAWLRK